MHHGTLQDVVAHYNYLDGYNHGELLWFVHLIEEALEAKKHTVVNHRSFESRKQGYMIYNEEEIAAFSTDYCAYLKSKKRQITEETAKLWGIRWDKEDNRLIIPVRNRKKELVGVRYREIDTKRYRPLLRFDLQRWFYGEQFFDAALDYILVVEGEFDAMKMDQLGFPAMAIFGSTVHARQLGKLNRFKGDVYLMLDGDLSGRKGSQNAKEELPKAKIVELPDGVDPGDINDPDYVEKLLSKADEGA